MIDLHSQEGWGRSPLAAGTKEGAMLEISSFKALKLSKSSAKGKLMVGVSSMPGEDLGRGIGPGGLRVLVIETASSSSSQKNQRTAIMLWDANGFAPNMNEELQEGLKRNLQYQQEELLPLPLLFLCLQQNCLAVENYQVHL